MVERAIILAAGLGLRMRPITDKLPKPLVPVLGKPLIDYSLDFVQEAGIEQAVVNASYLADALVAHLQKRAHPHVTISREAEPLETGGGIREALGHLGTAPFLSVNSDTICVNNSIHAVERLRRAWDDARMDALLLVQPMERVTGFEGPGDFFVSPAGAIRRRGDADSAPYVFTGIQLLHPRFFKGCPATGAFSLNVLYNRGMAADGTLSRVFALPHDGGWLHVGDPAGLAAAEAYLTSR